MIVHATLERSDLETSTISTTRVSLDSDIPLIDVLGTDVLVNATMMTIAPIFRGIDARVDAISIKTLDWSTSQT